MVSGHGLDQEHRARWSAAWYDRAVGDRYDYNYSEQELSEWGTRLLQTDAPVKRALVFFNNCYHGQAPNNAKWLMEWIKQHFDEDAAHA